MTTALPAHAAAPPPKEKAGRLNGRPGPRLRNITTPSTPQTVAQDQHKAQPLAVSMRGIRVGMFANDHAMLVAVLSANEYHALGRFHVEYLRRWPHGIADVDAAVVRITRFKRWPDLKARLHTYGRLVTVDGILRDPDLDESLTKQFAYRERQRDKINGRWERERARKGSA